METKRDNQQNILALSCILAVAAVLSVRLWAAGREACLEGPSHVTTQGHRVVVNVNHNVYRFDKDGTLEKLLPLETMGIAGPVADMQLLQDGTLLIGDRASGTIRRCEAKGVACERISPPPGYELKDRFSFRLEEATDRIFICDNVHHRLLMHDLETGAFRPVTEAGMLLYPNGVWMSSKGPVYVADTNHHRVVSVILDAEGSAVVTPILSGKTGLGRWDRTWPVALTRGPAGKWWVLNANGWMEKADLLVYDPAGTALKRIALPQGGDPFGMAWLSGRLLLTDPERFQIYAVDAETGTVNTFENEEFQKLLSNLKERKKTYGDMATTALILSIGLVLAAAMIALRSRSAHTYPGREKGVTMEGQGTHIRKGSRVSVKPWPTEIPLFVMVFTMALGFWMFLVLSVVGLAYAIFIGLFIFVSHLAFVTYVRGSAVRLGPEQFPELHRRIEELSARAGLKRAPEAYLMQAGGALNALATKFLRSRMVILFSDLLEACGENTAARDMIIGHELGHIRAGHLRGLWFLIPGMAVPFLGSLYSQAREYTCDRYGAALCGDRQGALVGLTILAAGGAKGPQVNLRAFVNQQRDLNTGLMTLGKWMATHPPLCDRVAALNPRLSGGSPSTIRGKLGAFGVVGTLLLLPILLTGAVMHTVVPAMKKTMGATKTVWEQPEIESDEEAPQPVAAFRDDPGAFMAENEPAAVKGPSP